MSFVKRAGLYVLRHKLKSLILLLVLTLISTFVLTGIAIQSSAEDAAYGVRSSVSGKIKLGIDQNASNTRQEEYDFGNGNSAISTIYTGDKITDEVIEALKATDGVTGYNAKSNYFGGFGVDFNLIPGMFSMGNAPAMTDAVVFSEKHDGFTSGGLSLKEGRHITDSDKQVIMISNELAEYNNLSVGDTMTYRNIDVNRDFTFTIVGIFTGTEGQGENAITPSQVPSNQCIISHNDLFDIFKDIPEWVGYVDVDLFVEDPLAVQNVYERISSLPEIKGKSFTLGIDTEEYSEIEDPLESLQSLVLTLIIIISIVSVAILALLLTLWTRGRVKETGILMSIGISKPKIIGQFILEAVLIAVISFGISYPVSSAIADTTGEFILTQVIDSENLQSKDTSSAELGVYDGSMYGDLLGGKSSEDNAAPEIDVKVTPDYLIWVYAIGTLLTMCAVLVASYTTIRLKPREILSKMS